MTRDGGLRNWLFSDPPSFGTGAYRLLVLALLIAGLAVWWTLRADIRQVRRDVQELPTAVATLVESSD